MKVPEAQHYFKKAYNVHFIHKDLNGIRSLIHSFSFKSAHKQTPYGEEPCARRQNIFLNYITYLNEAN